MLNSNLHGAGLSKILFFCGFSFTLLFLNFCTNLLGSAEQRWFASFDRSSERHIMARLIKSRQDGIFSSGGLAVRGVTSEEALKDPLNFFNDQFDNFKAYTENVTVKNFAPPYYSQICGQGIFFSILDTIIPYSPAIKLRIFHGIAAMLTAFVVMAVIAWFYIEFGLFVGITVLAFAVFSQWLTVFARNLWWSTWAFYLPMVIVMLYYLCRRKNIYMQYIKLGSVGFFSVLIKTIFNGYEYITTTLIMMVVPMVYYGYLNKESFALFLNGLIKITIGAGLAIAVSVFILTFQIASVSGSLLDGLSHVTYSLKKRTHATPNMQKDPVHFATHAAPTLSVVNNYLHGGFCGFDTSVFNFNSSAPQARYYVSYARLILFFALMTLVLYLSSIRGTAKATDRSLYALIVASWFSILAPLSWFVVFKGHSYAHFQLNFIVWQMPFTFFGAAITGLAARNSFSMLLSAIRRVRT